MGRRIRLLYSYFKKLLFWLFIGWLVMYVIECLNMHYTADVEKRAQIIRPSIVEIDNAGMEQFLREPRQTTLIFVYSTRSALSRWYFSDFNKMAAKYGQSGVRILYVSVDDDVNDLADFLASQGDLYFIPLHLSGREAQYFPAIIGKLGGDPFGGALPYMGIMNAVNHLRDFSQAIVRTGKIEEVLVQTLRGG